MSQGNIGVPVQVTEIDPEKLDVCTVLEVINRISGKWAIGILLEAIRGPVRFTELERSVAGISRRMLTLTLRNLESDGLLVRTIYPTVPPRVEYEATPMAKELYQSLSGLLGWAEQHREDIAAARLVYDGQATG
ncbi:HxlR family transcriptional regulator [Amycolatopsis mediterranei S699]|uniref:HxlR family transcriptional regulator n=2 Tax=Amycolatopsis mediterranei TaxID=33910 RepID=A0A0H3D9Y5_AMYMU|nr:helix-turn-helix domain-containing protein [Amycolatopsis mediterranei]ADJ47815.1 HxlR family transcriptional regulator [Amycolatopsis mediterranei U32]AEK44704.1 HxlR family transcriptional regulator [Amycolatopsis mediterranei S699]AFO79526.1 HxlR family transcriptional regulator [Amycolatopsis mediterranei S699]AGT86654.1 HxlR family transcriptional regulator [Amycolatopsis mediterranei RB]KDO10380.1 HxlR family transcriptional regulator [Amycolatopsis mediterranei]